MSSENLKAYYAQRQSQFEESLRLVKNKINLISNLRILSAVIFLILLYVGFNHTLVLYVLVIPVILFAYLVQQHTRYFDEKTHLENLVKIQQMEVDAIAGNFSNLHAGYEFVDPHHPYAHDLDIFGDGSLYQFTNRCNTLGGRKKFAAGLTSSLPDDKSIYRQQQSIQELASEVDFCQQIQASGMEIQEAASDRDQLKAWLKSPSFLYGKKFYEWLLYIVPILTVILVGLTFFVAEAKPLAILLVLVQWAVLGFHIKKVNAFHEYISSKKNILDKYAGVLTRLSKPQFKSHQLQQLSSDAQQAGIQVKKLASLVTALNARLNIMMNFFINSLLMYDLQCIYRLEKWKADHAGKLEKWLDAVTDAEVLCSWGTFAFNHSDFTYPKIEKSLSFSAVELGHPLIQQGCIVNDVFIGKEQRIQIVTGANMAGKSTFLRTVGVNLVLALAGAPVCAKEFSCSLLNLRTGMRTADSLKDHHSYFYAELDRLKSIMDELRSDIPLLILLDEILKGTNSTDKLSGSIALVKQLIPHPCLALIATHDLALGELEKTHPEAIRNFCFEATIENDQLYFDYKLKSGLAQKMNATFLMKKMGIIPA